MTTNRSSNPNNFRTQFPYQARRPNCWSLHVPPKAPIPRQDAETITGRETRRHPRPHKSAISPVTPRVTHTRTPHRRKWSPPTPANSPAINPAAINPGNPRPRSVNKRASPPSIRGPRRAATRFRCSAQESSERGWISLTSAALALSLSLSSWEIIAPSSSVLLRNFGESQINSTQLSRLLLLLLGATLRASESRREVGSPGAVLKARRTLNAIKNGPLPFWMRLRLRGAAL